MRREGRREERRDGRIGEERRGEEERRGQTRRDRQRFRLGGTDS